MTYRQYCTARGLTIEPSPLTPRASQGSTDEELSSEDGPLLCCNHCSLMRSLSVTRVTNDSRQKHPGRTPLAMAAQPEVKRTKTFVKTWRETKHRWSAGCGATQCCHAPADATVDHHRHMHAMHTQPAFESSTWTTHWQRHHQHGDMHVRQAYLQPPWLSGDRCCRMR